MPAEDFKVWERFFNARSWLVLVFFALLVVGLRLPSFYQSVVGLDWDDSLYLLVADRWLDGNPPYTAIWDNKPPGIYLLFAGAIAVLGHSVVAIRILAWIVVTLTCWLLYQLGRVIPHQGTAIGLAAGLLYAAASTGNGDGLSSNTELFFTPFAVFAVYLLLSQPSYFRELESSDFQRVFLIGLSLGIGLAIKQVVLFDFAAISLLLGAAVLLQGRSPTRVVTLVKLYGLLLIGFILPFLLFSLYFLVIGHFGDYFYANLTANRLRTVDNSFSPSLLLEAIQEQVLEPNLNLVFWICAIAAPIYVGINRRIDSKERWIIASLFVWFVFILIGFCAVFRLILFDHYFLQLTPVLSLLTAYMLTRLLLPGSQSSADWRRYAALAAVLLIVTIAQTKSTLREGARYVYYRQIKQVRHWQDTPAAVAEYIQARIAPTDYIYVVDDQPVIYFLTRANIPTRYAFPSFLIPGPGLPNIAGVEPLEELDRIMQKQPVYVIKRKGYNSKIEIGNNRAYFERLNQFLNQHYTLEHTLNSTELYRSSQPSKP